MGAKIGRPGTPVVALIGDGGSPFWGILFGAIGVYAAYKFFIDFTPRDKP